MDCRILLQGSTYRRLVLIETLYSRDQGANTSELLSLLNCTLPILLNDVRLINEKKSQIRIRKEEGLYSIDCPDEVGLASIYADVINEAPEFQILEELLYEQYQTLTDLANALFLSIPNTQRIVERLKKLLLPLNIQVKHRPLRLEGDEGMIRHLFYRYFTEKNPNLAIDLPQMRSVYQDFIVTFIEAFMEENQLQLLYVFSQRLIYNCFISLWRLKNGHSYPMEKLSSTFPKIPQGKGVGGLKFLAKDRFSLEVDQAVLKDMMWLIYSDSLVFSQAHLTCALKENTEFRKLYHDNRRLVAKILKFFHIENDAALHQQLTQVIQNATFLYPPETQHIDILLKTKCRFVANLWEKHQMSVNLLFHLIKEHQLNSAHGQTEEDFILTLVYWAITTVPNSLEEIVLSSEPVEILFLSITSPTEEKSLSEQVQKKIIGNYRVNFLSAFDKDFYQQVGKYDLIVTTGALDSPKIRGIVINVESLLTWKDLERIQQLVNEQMIHKLMEDGFAAKIESEKHPLLDVK